MVRCVLNVTESRRTSPPELTIWGAERAGSDNPLIEPLVMVGALDDALIKNEYETRSFG